MSTNDGLYKIGGQMKKHRKKRNVSFQISKGVLAAVVILIGILIIALSSFNYKKTVDLWLNFGKSILNSIGCTLVSAGFISLCLELSTIKSLVSDSIKGLMTGEGVIDHYTDTELTRLENEILNRKMQIASSDIVLTDSLYKYDRNLLDLLNSNYYEYHESTTILTPDSNNSVFLKHVTVEYKLINVSGIAYRGMFTWKSNSPIEDLSDDNIDQIFSIKQLVVCGEDCLDKKNAIVPHVSSISCNEYDTYDYLISINLPESTNREYTVKCIVEYYIPLNDISQIYRMRIPCKKFKHDFHINEDTSNKDKWKISGNAFTSFFIDQNLPDSNFRLDQNIYNAIKINFTDWSLPGSGYVIVSEKCD